MRTLTIPDFESTETAPRANTELLFGGDFCPIGRYAEKLHSEENIFDEDLQTLFKNTFSLINLEAPLCDDSLTSDSPSGSGLRGEPAVADYLRKLGIDAVGIANNHTRDFRDEGIQQTICNLERVSILNAGAGNNLAEAERPMEVKLNGLSIGIWPLAEKELNLAGDNSPGSSWFDPERNVRKLGSLKDRYDFLVVFLHAGHEFISTPSPRIRTACRRLVDAGADAVIAHHPHVMQGIEKYRNAVIAYSLGNLVFDSPYVSRHENTDSGYLVKLAISKHTIHRVELIPYKLRQNIVVSGLDGTEFDLFKKDIAKLSGNITKDSRFHEEWENNVRFRWESEYKQVLKDFSRNLFDAANKDYALRGRNLFASPTHREIIEKCFFMLEGGKLTRQ